MGRTLARKTLDNLGGSDQFRTKIVQTPNGKVRVRTHGGLPRSYPLDGVVQQDVPASLKRYFAFYTSMTATGADSPVVADACRFDKPVESKREGSFGMYGNCTWHSPSITLTWHGIGRSDRHASSASMTAMDRRVGDKYHGIIWKDGKEFARLPGLPALFGSRPCVVSAAMNGETLRAISIVEIPWDTIAYCGENYDKIATLALYEKPAGEEIQLVRTVEFDAAMLQSCWFNQSGTKAIGMMASEVNQGVVFELDFSTGAISNLAVAFESSGHSSGDHNDSYPVTGTDSGVHYSVDGYSRNFFKSVAVLAVDYKGDTPMWMTRNYVNRSEYQYSFSSYEEHGFPDGFEAASAFNQASRASIGLAGAQDFVASMDGSSSISPLAPKLLRRETTATQTGQLVEQAIGYMISEVGDSDFGDYHKVSSLSAKAYITNEPYYQFGKDRGVIQYLFDCEFVMATESYIVGGSWVNIPVYRFNFIARHDEVKSPYPDNEYSESDETNETFIGGDIRFDKLFVKNDSDQVLEKRFSDTAPGIENPWGYNLFDITNPVSILYDTRYVHASSSDGSISVVTDKNQPTDDVLYLFRGGVSETGANERLRHSDSLASPRLSPIFYRNYSQ